MIQICVLEERGERAAEERIRYRNLEEGMEAVAFLRRFAPACRIAVEALGLNRWFVNACREAGLDVLVVDPRKLDLKKLGKKTDSRPLSAIGSLRAAFHHGPESERSTKRGRRYDCSRNFPRRNRPSTRTLRGHHLRWSAPCQSESAERMASLPRSEEAS